jgi:HK97 family phage major capsid protein
MANQIPLLEGTNIAGGYLVRPEYGQTLINGLRRESVLSRISSNETTATKQRKYAIYAGRPTAEFVAEAADKPITGAEFSEMSIDIKKIATTVIYTEELLEDAEEDPTVFLSPDVIGGISDLVDAHGLGFAAGTAVTTQFNATLADSTTAVDYSKAKGDGIALAISNGMEAVEDGGYTPTHVVLDSRCRALLRNARQSGETTAAVYTNGFEREPDTLYGLPIAYSSNLQNPTVVDNVAGFVVAGQNLKLVQRKDITIRTSTEAVIGTHNMFRQNKLAMLWESRLGFGIHDINDAVAKIVVKA